MSNPETDINGTIRWYNDKGKLHRLDGPAIEWCRGNISWWINGDILFELYKSGIFKKYQFCGYRNKDIPKSIKQSVVVEILKLDQ